METQLDTFSESGFANAMNIYSEGGHSKSYAEVTLNAGLPSDVPEGTVISGSTEANAVVNGEPYEAATAGATTLKVRYAVSASQASYTECHVGGLVETKIDGCECQQYKRNSFFLNWKPTSSVYQSTPTYPISMFTPYRSKSQRYLNSWKSFKSWILIHGDIRQ